MQLFGIRTGSLRGKRIAILAADGFEHVELSIPRAALFIAGATCRVISLREGRIRGMNLTEPTRTVRVHMTLDDADPSLFDGLFIPGGFVGPDFLRQSRRARDFVAAFEAAHKPIVTLCHGPWLLVSANLVKGRQLAAWAGIRDDIVHAGGIWRDEAVVVDRNWLTSRGPQDLATFAPAMIEFLAGTTPSTAAAHALESSPPHEEPAAVVVGAVHLMPGPGLSALASAMVGTGLLGALRRTLQGLRRA
jgi:protease I